MRIGKAEHAQARAIQTGFEADRALGEPAFTVDVEGFEGPLDLLLELARRLCDDALRTDFRLCPAIAETRAHLRADEAAPRLDAGAGARRARPVDRPRRRLGQPRSLADRILLRSENAAQRPRFLVLGVA